LIELLELSFRRGSNQRGHLFKPAIDGKSDARFPSMSRTAEAQIDNPQKKNIM